MEGYERFVAALIARGIKTNGGESVLVRTVSGWMLNGRAIPNAHDAYLMTQVCESQGLSVVEHFGHHIAVVTKEG